MVHGFPFQNLPPLLPKPPSCNPNSGCSRPMREATGHLRVTDPYLRLENP